MNTWRISGPVITCNLILKWELLSCLCSDSTSNPIHKSPTTAFTLEVQRRLFVWTQEANVTEERDFPFASRNEKAAAARMDSKEPQDCLNWVEPVDDEEDQCLSWLLRGASSDAEKITAVFSTRQCLRERFYICEIQM